MGDVGKDKSEFGHVGFRPLLVQVGMESVLDLLAVFKKGIAQLEKALLSEGVGQGLSRLEEGSLSFQYLIHFRHLL